MKTIMITGVKGIGKTTLVRAISNSLFLDHADYADFMLDAMGSNDKDEIENLSEIERQRVILKVRTFLEDFFILQKINCNFFLLENHLTTIKNREIFITG